MKNKNRKQQKMQTQNPTFLLSKYANDSYNKYI